MANYYAIKAAVNAYIKQNGRKEITGSILNAVLNATIDSLGRFFQFAGGAMPTDDPGTPDQNVCYLATEPGLYTNFGNIRIANEEVALLFWNGEWVKESIALGIQEVNASVDNRVGTPSVDVSYSGGQLVLTFHNLKGEQGGTGDAAGFGTIGADITGGVGTPGVSIESSGDNTAKNLMFHFTNLKGETGVTSVVATIDDTSGLPSCQVSLVNGVLTLAFSGLKGLKGDTGVSADYPITIYNGLDSDATDQALAAAQGKILDQKISQVEDTADAIADNFVFGVLSNNILAPALILDRTTKYIRRTNGTTINATGGYGYTDYIPLDSNGLYSNSYLPTSGSYASSWMYYDADKVFLGNKQGHVAQMSEFPGAAYVRLNLGNPANLPAGQDYAIYRSTTELPYDTYKYGAKLKDNTITEDKIADGAVTEDKIADDAISTEKLADGAVTMDKAAFITRTLHQSKNLLNPATCIGGYISKNSGNLIENATIGRYATDYIPIDSDGLYCNCINTYGTIGGWAAYNSNKEYTHGGTGQATWQDGDAYVRMTINDAGLGTTYYVVKATDPHAYTPYFEPYYTYSLSDEIDVPAPETIPAYEPALSLAGLPGVEGEGDMLTNGYIVMDDFPRYIKRCFNLSAGGKISSFNQIDIGVGLNTSNGTFLRVNGSNIYFCRFYNGNVIYTFTQAHGLTITDFIDVSVYMDDGEMTARVATYGGVFTHTFNRLVDMESYGKPFVAADENTTLTEFSFRAGGVRFRLPVWVVGDSYCSWYGQRWVKQLQTSFGVSDFLLDGLAGGTSSDLYAELQRLLTYGTPKFLVWCLGMNDSFDSWNGVFTTLKDLCSSKGITLVLQTIPFPENNESGAAQKALINAEIKASGFRYFDGYAAVSSDDNGTWYEGYCADGVHTSVEGAKAMAARFLVDFPEILQ